MVLPKPDITNQSRVAQITIKCQNNKRKVQRFTCYSTFIDWTYQNWKKVKQEKGMDIIKTIIRIEYILNLSIINLGTRSKLQNTVSTQTTKTAENPDNHFNFCKLTKRN